MVVVVDAGPDRRRGPARRPGRRRRRLLRGCTPRGSPAPAADGDRRAAPAASGRGRPAPRGRGRRGMRSRAWAAAHRARILGWTLSPVRPRPRRRRAASSAIADGLVCAVVQQHDTGEVLMVGWMDDEALHRTLTTGRVDLLVSRSRQEYWRKGDTSGHVQWVRGGARSTATATPLLVRVDQVGRGLPHRRPHLLRRGAGCRPGVLDRSEEPGDQRPRDRDADLRCGETWPDLDASASWPATAGSSRWCAACSPTARPRSGSTASWPQDRPGHLPAGVRRARRGLVALLASSAPPAAATLTERDGQAHWIGEPPVGRAHRRRPARGAARHRRRAARTERPARAAAADRRAWSASVTYDAVRRWERVPDDRRRRARRARAGDDAGHRPRRPRPRRRLAAAGRQRGQLRRHRRAGGRGVGRRRRAGWTDDRRARRRRAEHRRRAST